jgi:hypothetical protein
MSDGEGSVHIPSDASQEGTELKHNKKTIEEESRATQKESKRGN